jgi:type I restriction enzyme S subunit
MSAAWPIIPLGEFLSERRETPSDIDVLSGKTRIVDKVSFNDGRIHIRQSQNTKTGMILVRPGDILVSGINAAKGAIAIHDPEASEALAATIHYGAYQADEERAQPKFLWWLLRSNLFRDLLATHVPGGIKTELKSTRLLPIPVPLPPIDEQRRIVAQIETLAAKITEARNLRLSALDELAVLSVKSRDVILGSVVPSGMLGAVLTCAPRNGWSPVCNKGEHGTPVLTLSAVTGWRFNKNAYKRTNLPTRPDAHYWVEEGDLLITRSNTPELVGHAAIHSGSPTPCIFPDLMMKLSLNKHAADTRFVWYWLQSTVVRDYIKRSAKGTSPTMKKISQPIVEAIPFPENLSVDQQTEIVSKLDVLQERLNAARALQLETSAELDALLPTILDRAFKGEL